MSDDSCTILGKLVADERGPWVTFNGAKAQIRQVAKDKGFKIGTFAPKSEGKQILKVPVLDQKGNVIGSITSSRKVGADICLIKAVQASSLSPEELASIMADEAKGRERIQKDVS